MRNKKNSLRTAVAAVAAILLVIVTPALALDPMTVVKSTVSGAVVDVTVKNNTQLVQVGTVSVQAVCGDTAVWSKSVVTLLPGQSAVVPAAFASAVSSVKSVGIICGIIEDPNPY